MDARQDGAEDMNSKFESLKKRVDKVAPEYEPYVIVTAKKENQERIEELRQQGKRVVILPPHYEKL